MKEETTKIQCSVKRQMWIICARKDCAYVVHACVYIQRNLWNHYSCMCGKRNNRKKCLHMPTRACAGEMLRDDGTTDTVFVFLRRLSNCTQRKSKILRRCWLRRECVVMVLTRIWRKRCWMDKNQFIRRIATHTKIHTSTVQALSNTGAQAFACARERVWYAV